MRTVFLFAHLLLSVWCVHLPVMFVVSSNYRFSMMKEHFLDTEKVSESFRSAMLEDSVLVCIQEELEDFRRNVDFQRLFERFRLCEEGEKQPDPREGLSPKGTYPRSSQEDLKKGVEIEVSPTEEVDWYRDRGDEEDITKRFFYVAFKEVLKKYVLDFLRSEISRIVEKVSRWFPSPEEERAYLDDLLVSWEGSDASKEMKPHFISGFSMLVRGDTLFYHSELLHIVERAGWLDGGRRHSLVLPHLLDSRFVLPGFAAVKDNLRMRTPIVFQLLAEQVLYFGHRDEGGGVILDMWRLAVKTGSGPLLKRVSDLLKTTDDHLLKDEVRRLEEDLARSPPLLGFMKTVFMLQETLESSLHSSLPSSLGWEELLEVAQFFGESMKSLRKKFESAKATSSSEQDFVKYYEALFQENSKKLKNIEREGGESGFDIPHLSDVAPEFLFPPTPLVELAEKVEEKLDIFFREDKRASNLFPFFRKVDPRLEMTFQEVRDGLEADGKKDAELNFFGILNLSHVAMALISGVPSVSFAHLVQALDWVQQIFDLPPEDVLLTRVLAILLRHRNQYFIKGLTSLYFRERMLDRNRGMELRREAVAGIADSIAKGSSLAAYLRHQTDFFQSNQIPSHALDPEGFGRVVRLQSLMSAIEEQLRLLSRNKQVQRGMSAFNGLSTFSYIIIALVEAWKNGDQDLGQELFVVGTKLNLLLGIPRLASRFRDSKRRAADFLLVLPCVEGNGGRLKPLTLPIRSLPSPSSPCSPHPGFSPSILNEGVMRFVFFNALLYRKLYCGPLEEEDPHCAGFSVEEAQHNMEVMRVLTLPTGETGEWILESTPSLRLQGRVYEGEELEEALELATELGVKWRVLSPDVELEGASSPILDLLREACEGGEEGLESFGKVAEFSDETWDILLD